MKLECYKCHKEQDIVVEVRGPHLRANCSICNSYIKFLNQDEKQQLEDEEDRMGGGDG